MLAWLIAMIDTQPCCLGSPPSGEVLFFGRTLVPILLINCDAMKTFFSLENIGPFWLTWPDESLSWPANVLKSNAKNKFRICEKKRSNASYWQSFPGQDILYHFLGLKYQLLKFAYSNILKRPQRIWDQKMLIVGSTVMEFQPPGEWTPGKTCCWWWLTFWQPMQTLSVKLVPRLA